MNKLIVFLLCLASYAGEYKITISNVYDGDTITAHVDLGFEIVMLNQQIRLAGIDAPEINQSTKLSDAERIEGKLRGIESRDFLIALLKGRTVVMRTRDDKEREKYGRILGNLYIYDKEAKLVSVSMLMLSAGHAKAYMEDEAL